MKNYEEMAETVFRRIDEYKEVQRKRRKIIYTTAASLSCACLVAIMGFTAWKSGRLAPSGGIQGNTPTVTEGQPATEPTQNAPIGGNYFCQIHDEQYHLFTSQAFLGSYLTNEQLSEWKNTISTEPLTDGSYCTPEYNIKACIDYFNIPREDFEQLCENKWTSRHNINLLYSDDIDAIEAYYRDINARNATMIKQTRMRDIKSFLIEICYGMTRSEIWSKPEEELTEIEKELVDIDKISLIRIIQLLDADRSKFDQALEKTNELLPLYGRPDYNYQFDLVYNEDGSLKDFTIDDNLSVVEQDALFAGVDNFFTD